MNDAYRQQLWRVEKPLNCAQIRGKIFPKPPVLAWEIASLCKFNTDKNYKPPPVPDSMFRAQPQRFSPPVLLQGSSTLKKRGG